MGFLGSALYQNAVAWHVQRGRKVIPLEPRVEQLLALNAVAASGCTVEEIRTALRGNLDAFNAYASARLDLFQGDSEEEYPPGETPPREERAKTLSIDGYPNMFLVSPLIEFTIMRSRPSELEAFVRRYRIPNASKHSKTLLALFSRMNER
jgi:hypothetical protein